MSSETGSNFEHLSLGELEIMRDKAEAHYKKTKKALKRDRKKYGSSSHFVIASQAAFDTASANYSRIIAAIERRSQE